MNDERILSARAGPTLGICTRRSNTARSSRVEKPNSATAFSLTLSRVRSVTPGVPGAGRSAAVVRETPSS